MEDGNGVIDMAPVRADPAGDAILDAALRLIADGGLTAFTTDRLAAEARVLQDLHLPSMGGQEGHLPGGNGTLGWARPRR